MKKTLHQLREECYERWLKAHPPIIIDEAEYIDIEDLL